MRSENVKIDPFTITDIQYLKNQDREQLLDFQTATNLDLGAIEREYGIYREATEYVSTSDGKTKTESRVRNTKEFRDMRKSWINGLAGEIDISFITQINMWIMNILNLGIRVGSIFMISKSLVCIF